MRDAIGFHLDIYVVGILGIAFLAAGYGFFIERAQLIPGGGYAPFAPAAMFGLLGAALSLKAFHLLVSWIRFGRSHLKLGAVPIPLGGPLKAELVMSRPPRSGARLRVRLKLVNVVEKQYHSVNKPFPTVEERAVEYSTVWQDEDVLSSDGSGRFPIEFAVPDDQPETALPHGHDGRLWVLEAEDPGGKAQAYHAEFEVPIFRVPLSLSDAAEAKAITARRQQKLEAVSPEAGFKVRLARTADGGMAFLLPPVRSAGGAIAQTIVLVVSVALMVAAYGHLALWIVVIWAILNVLFYLWIARLWFAPERVTIGNGRVSVKAGLFGIVRSMPTGQISSIHALPLQPPWLASVRIRGSGWRVFDVGQGIHEAREAVWLALQMSKAAGVAPSSPIPANQATELMDIATALVKDMGEGSIGSRAKSLMDRMREQAADETPVLPSHKPD